MILVNEFKAANSLTERKWRTMKERFRSENPGVEFNHREGMEYYITDAALPIFESYLPKQRSTQQTSALVPTFDAEILPSLPTYRPTSNSAIVQQGEDVRAQILELHDLTLSTHQTIEASQARIKHYDAVDAQLDALLANLQQQEEAILINIELERQERIKAEAAKLGKVREIRRVKDRLERLNEANQEALGG